MDTSLPFIIYIPHNYSTAIWSDNGAGQPVSEQPMTIAIAQEEYTTGYLFFQNTHANRQQLQRDPAICSAFLLCKQRKGRFPTESA